MHLKIHVRFKYSLSLMKAVILAGGFGTRISEETHLKPKPMIKIGGKPILWHIMKLLHCQGINEFLICLGYKGYVIKEYFANYMLHSSDLTFDGSDCSLRFYNNKSEPWKVSLFDTGEETMTAGRLLRIKEHVGDDDFLFTYGDGVSDVNISKLIAYHKSHGKLATVTSVIPPGRYGAIKSDNGKVLGFVEKPRGDGGTINGGFFILKNACFDYIAGDQSIWEQDVLVKLAKSSQLMAYDHKGFWHPMDTLRDKRYLESLWEKHEAPWKRWD